jgi:membrane protein
MGSLVGLLVWAIASVGFGFYAASFSKYNSTYGSIGGIIIFLLWVWISNNALLFGAELDAEIERDRELQAGIEAEEVLQLPPRDTKQSDKKAEQHERFHVGDELAEDSAAGRVQRSPVIGEQPLWNTVRGDAL